MGSNIHKPDFDVLLFDLGGVLIDFAGFDELSRLLPDSPGRAEIRSRWINSEAVQSFERGHIDPDEFARRIIAEYQLHLSMEGFIEQFVEWARGPYLGAVELLAQVRQTHRVASLSNSNALHTPIHRRSLEHVVETFYFSDEIGHVKPDREIFDHVVCDLVVPPERIAFFDDTTVNVEAAEAFGLNAYVVDGIDALEDQLQNLGIAIPSLE
jgi:putative hydrolase of the HAD superfamily